MVGLVYDDKVHFVYPDDRLGSTKVSYPLDKVEEYFGPIGVFKECPNCDRDDDLQPCALCGEGTKLNNIIEDVKSEYESAVEKHSNSFNSAHEGYAVLLEEVEEAWDLIKRDRPVQEIKEEMVQVAAMAIRFLNDISL
jgi:hypothetical protein